MKSKYLFLALSAMALVTGCSNDETIEVNQGNGIDFSVTAGKLTRAADIKATSTIDQFKVWAFTGDVTTPYMNGVLVNKGTDGKWTYDNTKFWPETNVDFYAVSPQTPQSGTVSVSSSTQQITDYVVTNGKEDLLYSMNKGEKKDDHKSTPVSINFRHALSQIVFKVKETSTSTIDVKIKSIKVEGIANQSTLTWATNTTGPNMATDQELDTEKDATWGTWANPTGAASYYAVEDLGSSPYTVTTTANQVSNNSLLLMPQRLDPWLTIGNDGVATVTGKARVVICCQITDKETGVQLYPKVEKAGDPTYADVAISLTNPNNDPHRGETNESQLKHDKWMQGKKYVYTLIFGEGAGYDPDPDPEDPDKPVTPDPVLVPITFEVTVDAFQDAGNDYNIDMSSK